MSLIRDDQGIAREAEKRFAPYESALFAQWAVERASHDGARDGALDLVFVVDTETHAVDVHPRLRLQSHPSVPAWTTFDEKPGNAAWVVLARENLCVGIRWPKEK